MPWTPILNWTSPETQAETFCQIYQRQHKTLFCRLKKPPHIFATEVRPESSPRGFTAQLQVFLISSVAIPMSQGRACNAEEKETLWGATERAMQVTDVLKWDKYLRTVSRAVCGGL